MSLEDVKVGDRVWRTRLLMGVRERDFIVVTRVTTTRIYSNDLVWYRTAQSWRTDAGEPYGRLATIAGRQQSIATDNEIAAYEAEQAQKKAAAEAAEAEKRQAEQEKRRRMARLSNALTSFLSSCGGDYIRIEFDGHRYEIKEIE